MRLPALQSNSLEDGLRASGEELTEDGHIQFQMAVAGFAHTIPDEVQSNLYALSREAICDAVKYGRPSRISLDLTYLGGGGVQIIVQDDGVGFDIPAPASKRSHWGLRGMRELPIRHGL